VNHGPAFGIYDGHQMPTPTATLRASLEKHNDTFEALLKLIPAQYYIINDELEDQVCFGYRNREISLTALVLQVASKYQKHSKNKKAPKQAVKEASRKGKREKVCLFNSTSSHSNLKLLRTARSCKSQNNC
jgi:hypothetical protein